ncbi:MAG: hypothetical protein RL756_2337 [Pseudomonadota bacterium]|jgi:hypothetical protein
MLIECSNCGSLATIPVVYGKPSHEILEAEKYGLVALGGCVVDEIDRSCRRCSWQWATGQKSSAYRDDRPAVESILENLECKLLEIRQSIERDFMQFGRHGVDEHGKWVSVLYGFIGRHHCVWAEAIDRLLSIGAEVVIRSPEGNIQTKYSVQLAHTYLLKVSSEWFNHLRFLSEGCFRLGRAGFSGNVDDLKSASVDVQLAREALDDFVQRLRHVALYVSE